MNVRRWLWCVLVTDHAWQTRGKKATGYSNRCHLCDEWRFSRTPLDPASSYMAPFAALGLRVSDAHASTYELSAGMGPDFSLQVDLRARRWVVYVSGLPDGEFFRRTRFRWRAVRWVRAALAERRASR